MSKLKKTVFAFTLMSMCTTTQSIKFLFAPLSKILNGLDAAQKAAEDMELHLCKFENAIKKFEKKVSPFCKCMIDGISKIPNRPHNYVFHYPVVQQQEIEETQETKEG